MKKFIKIALFNILFFGALGASSQMVWAQDGTSAGTAEFATTSSSVPASVSEGSTPRATSTSSVPGGATTTTNPTSGTMQPTPPRPMPIPMEPVTTPPVPTPTQTQPDDTNKDAGLSPVGVYVAGVFALALAWFGVYALKAKKKVKKDPREEKDETRCLNLKKLMEEKLREVADARGQLENMAKSKARSMAKGAIKNTPVTDLVSILERAEKEYGRLQKLYAECTTSFGSAKRVIIVHGWGGYPEEGWFPWLKNELEKNGFQVLVPAMPESSKPGIEPWATHLSKVAGDVDEETYFVGHSIGCQTILRYLESLPDGVRVGGAIFVAGWFTLSNLKTEDEKETARPWLETPIDFEKVRSHSNKFFAVFSDNDEDVPSSNKELFEQRLGAQTVVEHAKGHFSGGDGVKELPIVLEAVLEQMK